jgi:hypothetical protein
MVKPSCVTRVNPWTMARCSLLFPRRFPTAMLRDNPPKIATPAYIVNKPFTAPPIYNIAAVGIIRHHSFCVV